MKFQLAQLNIAKAVAPLDSPAMAEFVNALEEINHLAEQSPGFVWRYQTEAGNALEARLFADPLVIVNLSVWDSVENLKNYVYRSMHGKFFARRQNWFEPMTTPHMVLWWVPAGTLPTLEEATERLLELGAKGETERAFTFRNPALPPTGG